MSLAVLRFCPSIVNLYSPQNTTRAVQNVKDKDKTNDLVTVDTVGYSDDVSGVAMLLEMRLGNYETFVLSCSRVSVLYDDSLNHTLQEDGNKKAKSSSSSKRTASDNEDKVQLHSAILDFNGNDTAHRAESLFLVYIGTFFFSIFF